MLFWVRWGDLRGHVQLGGTLRDNLAPDGGYIGACVLTCVLVGRALKDHLAPMADVLGACVLTCVLVGGALKDYLAPDGGYILSLIRT